MKLPKRSPIAGFDLHHPFACICLEVHPASAYRLFTVAQHELRNAVAPLGHLTKAHTVTTLEERLFAVHTSEHKIALLHQYMASTMSASPRDKTFEYCATSILTTRGTLPIHKLAQQTAYSNRWLRAKFADTLGLSPKTFASLIRFQHSYQDLVQSKHESRRRNLLYELYHDEAHFIKEFKRFTGHSPGRYAALQNNVGEPIYADQKDTSDLYNISVRQLYMLGPNHAIKGGGHVAVPK